MNQAYTPLSGSSSPATNPLEKDQYYFEEQCSNGRLTWFIVVEHEEELDKPGQLDCLEHLSDEAQLAEVNHEPEQSYNQFSANQGKITVYGFDNYPFWKLFFSVWYSSIDIS